MSTISDFLFGGAPPTSTTTYGSTTSTLPAWYNDYTQGLLAKANTIAAQPYQTYQGPRVAPATSQQQQAWQGASDMQGQWNPTLQSGINMTQQAGQGSALGAASPYLQAGANGSAAAAAQPYLGAAASGSALGAAAPWLMAGSQTATGPNLAAYMNPYTDNVINRASDLATRNWREQIMPGIQDTFTNAGQYGSSRMAETAYKGARDVEDSLQSQAASQLAGAFTNAQGSFQNDQNRMLTAAGQVGSLGGQDLSRMLEAGSQAGALTSQDLNRQIDVGGQMGALSSADLQRMLASGNQMGNLASTGQRMGINDLGALDAAGAEQQGQIQKNYDTAYGDWNNQKNYAAGQVDWLNNIIRGFQQPTSTTYQQQTPNPGAYNGVSPLAQLAGAGSLIYGATQKP